LFTRRQSNLIEQLSNPTAEVSNAPHVSELAESLTRAFGGVDALADMLAGLANDPKRPDWLRTRAYGIVVNVVSQASKLEANEPTDDLRGASEAELKHAGKIILAELLGIDDAMQSDLKTVVTAWPELPQATRESIVAAVQSAQSSNHNE
jgi:hypothetical protein